MLSKGKWNRYKKLLIGVGFIVEVDKISMQYEFEQVLEDGTETDKKIVKLGEHNKLSDDDLILSVKSDSCNKKVGFGLVQNAKSLEFSNRN